MTILILMVLAVWGGTSVYALAYAHDHLSEEALADGGESAGRAQLKGRLIAFGAVGVGLLSLGSVAAAMTGPAQVMLWPLVGLAVPICGAPLLLPTGKVLGVKVSGPGLVTTSLLLTMLFGVALAVYFVVRLVLSGPEIY